ncbi:MAG: hypothetical protein U5L03_04600 [Burkholderiaceae bacterium]|nr:hypothetical protein [Burkholderiaceae bacterium]
MVVRTRRRWQVGVSSPRAVRRDVLPPPAALHRGRTTMRCSTDTNDGDGSDRTDGSGGRRYFDESAVAWLVGEAVRHLHGEGKEAELYYQRAIELLRGQKDATEAIVRLAQQVDRDDTGVRWSLLHVLGDVSHAQAAGYLVESALARLPEHDQSWPQKSRQPDKWKICS